MPSYFWPIDVANEDLLVIIPCLIWLIMLAIILLFSIYMDVDQILIYVVPPGIVEMIDAFY